MNKKALISVISKQNIENGENIEVVTPGEFYKKDNNYYAVYKETEISGMQGTTTIFKMGDKSFSLIRQGSTSATMEFEKKKDTVSLYNTPYGALELKINTKDLDINIDDNGGKVFINYNMSVSGQKQHNTMLNIKIKTQNI